MKKQTITLAAIRQWPPTTNVTQAALALGVSRSSLYQAIAADSAPVETIHVNRRVKILTASLLRVLEGSNGSDAGAA